ncbi:hypothetical protein GQ457_04G037710 [Hibiscus cannabinus]
MGLNVDTRCILCVDGCETRNHLFVECVFSQQVWKSILNLYVMNRCMLDWEGEVSWLYTNLKGKLLLVLICKLVWNSYVYHIWEERNIKKFQNVSRDCNCLVNSIKESISIRVQGRILQVNDVNRAICKAWRIL